MTVNLTMLDITYLLLLTIINDVVVRNPPLQIKAWRQTYWTSCLKLLKKNFSDICGAD